MSATTLFFIIIAIILVNFIKDKILDALNAKHYNDPIPEELSDVYDENEYKKSQTYKQTNYRFGIWSSSFSLVLSLAFVVLDGFEYVDNIARGYSENPIVIALLFFGIIMFASSVITLPFAYYKTFVIEEQFGFNKTTKKTFVLDKIKGLLMMAILGGGILALIIWIYQLTQDQVWLYAWGVVTIFSIFMNMFYS
jgi:STE24 endopeptidase